jgi:hypothetical protein
VSGGRTMRRRRRAAAAVLLPLLTAIASAPAAAQPAQEGAAAFNGTWEMRVGTVADRAESSGDFRIWALDERRVQVEFDGSWAHKTGMGLSANVGQASGIGVFDDGAVTFRQEGGECKFILRLHDDRLVVRQIGYPCFGFNVTAEGTYRRVDASRPTFELSGSSR